MRQSASLRKSQRRKISIFPRRPDESSKIRRRRRSPPDEHRNQSWYWDLRAVRSKYSGFQGDKAFRCILSTLQFMCVCARKYDQKGDLRGGFRMRSKKVHICYSEGCEECEGTCYNSECSCEYCCMFARRNQNEWTAKWAMWILQLK